MRSFLRSDAALGLLLAAAVFPVYLLTLSATVGTEDPGEIATALYTLGVVHPTGYPLFTMLGWAFAHLPLGGSVIWRLNLFGAVLTTAATFLFFRAFLFLLSDPARVLFGLPRAAAENDPPRQGFVNRAAAAAATLVFAFSAVYWAEAVSLEVYALHLVFLALVTWLFLRALAGTASGAGAGRNGPWMLFAFALGLSFTNHMMTVLLAPAFLYLYFAVHGPGRLAWIRILKMAPPFLAALSLYLYLPLRSLQGPVMNWGEPDTPAAFWKHVTAAQYGQQMFSSWNIAGRKLLQFAVDLPGDFGYLPLLLALVGLWSLRRARRLLIFSSLIFLVGLVYAINYAFDDPNFNLNSHFMVAAWAAFGARALLEAGARGRGAWRGGAYLACAAIALCPLVFNYPRLDKSRDSAVEDYARNVLNSMDSGAVLFTNEYERVGGPAFYLQMVEGYRRDVVVLDIILLGNPWFFPHLERRHPWLMRGSRHAIDAYRAEVTKYLAGRPDKAAHNARLQEMFFSIVGASRAAGHPVYVSSGINPAMIEAYQHAPSGMVFRLLDEADTIRVPVREPNYRPLPESNPITPVIRGDYALAYAYQGAYRLSLGDTAQGRALLRKALVLRPDFPEAKEWLHGP